MQPMPPTPPESESADELDSLLARMRDEAPPAHVASVARSLPARVRARLEEEAKRVFFLRWGLGLGALSAVCAVVALADLRRAGELALADPLLAGWLFSLLG